MSQFKMKEQPKPEHMCPTCGRLKDEFEPLARLKRDLKKAAATLSDREARFLVDGYYLVQEYRKAAANQKKALGGSGEPHEIVEFFMEESEKLENNIKSVLDTFGSSKAVGRWAKSIWGIGPVLSAGLLAYIDIEQAPTVGHIWRFAGLDPTQRWLGKEKAEAWVNSNLKNHDLEWCLEHGAAHVGARVETIRRYATTNQKGKSIRLTKDTLSRALAKRPWSAGLKTLCWKIGESFVKVSGNENDYYGKIYLQRKAYEVGQNDCGNLTVQAKQKLVDFKIGEDKDARAWYEGYYPAGTTAAFYEVALTPDELEALEDKKSEGKSAKLTAKRMEFLKSVRLPEPTGQPMLPPGHIQARAERYTVKLFLSHYHGMAYRERFGKEPPLPYPIAMLNHAHMIPAPE